MKLLTVVVSYNLPGFLENFVKSYLHFCPVGELLVVDNHSTHPGVAAFLQSVASDRVHWRLSPMRNDDSRKTGSLYDANNLAIDFALSRNYDYVLFLQDDMQFVGWDRDLEACLARVFSDSSVSIASPVMLQDVENFLRRYQRRGSCWVSMDQGFFSTGIMSTAWIRRHAFRFAGNEWTLSAQCAARGWNAAALPRSFVTFLPWPAVRRAGTIIGRDLDSSETLFFERIARAPDHTPVGEHAVLALPGSAQDECRPTYAQVLFPYQFSQIDLRRMLATGVFNLRYVGRGSLRIPSRTLIARCIVTVAVGVLRRRLLRVGRWWSAS